MFWEILIQENMKYNDFWNSRWLGNSLGVINREHRMGEEDIQVEWEVETGACSFRQILPIIVLLLMSSYKFRKWMTHFSIPDDCLAKGIVFTHLFTSSEHPNRIGQLGECAPKSSSRADFSLAVLCCAETASDFLPRVGHCDLKCSGSTPEIPPLAMEVLPNPLGCKTSNRLVCLCCSPPPLLLPAWCGFLAVSCSPLSGPNLSTNMFLLPTLPILSSMQHPCSPAFAPYHHPSWARVQSHRNLLQQALLGVGCVPGTGCKGSFLLFKIKWGLGMMLIKLFRKLDVVPLEQV